MWKRNVARRACVAVALLSITSCGASDPTVHAQPAPAAPARADLGALDGRHLVFESAAGFIPVPDHQLGMSFQNGRMGFSADCNSHSASATLDADQLVITGRGMSTEMGCSGALHAQGEWFAMFLKSKPRVTFDGPRVRFTGYGATLVFVDYKVMYPDLPLVGTAWATNGAISHGMVGMRPGRQVDTTITFHDDGSLKVTTPCSTASGRHLADSGVLTLSDVTYSESTCTEANADDIHMRAVITDGTVTYEIDSSRLMLLRDIGANEPIGWFAYGPTPEAAAP